MAASDGAPKGIFAPLPCRLRARLRGDAAAYSRLAARAADAIRFIVPAGMRGWCWRLASCCSARRPRLLPGHRRRPDPAPCPRARRDPDRGRPSASSRRSRTRSARSSRTASASSIVDNIGLPARAYNLAFADGSTIGVNDGVILVSLKEGHAPTADYVRKLRAGAAGRVPRSDLLLPGRRHRHADPQFRPAGADRRAHRRL